MPDDIKYLLWVDLETTGLPADPATVPLESAWYLTGRNGRGYEGWNRSPVSYLIDGDFGDPRSWDPVVATMHAESGLLKDLLDPRRTVCSLADVEEQVLAKIDRSIGPDAKVALAGAGVGHAELAIWVPKWFPRIAARAAYWPNDVSVMRRMLEGWGFNVPHATATRHRAGPDIEAALALHRWFEHRITDLARFWAARDDQLPMGVEWQHAFVRPAS